MPSTTRQRLSGLGKKPIRWEIPHRNRASTSTSGTSRRVTPTRATSGQCRRRWWRTSCCPPQRVEPSVIISSSRRGQEVFAKRQKLGEDVIGYAYTIKMRALAKLGELLKQLPKATGGLNEGAKNQLKGRASGTGNRPRQKIVDTRPRLVTLGVDKVAKVARQLAVLPSATRKAIAQRETTIARAVRETKAVALRKAVNLPTAKYRVIYADPPWSYNDKADDGSTRRAGGVARQRPHRGVQRALRRAPSPVRASRVWFSETRALARPASRPV